MVPHENFTQHDPLTDAELDRLGDFHKGCKGGSAMNVEALDGFFAAFIAGPETVMPSEYYREVFGGEMSDACEFGSLDEANEILGLMMRHWNTIAGTLFKGEVYVPLVLEDEDSMAHGNDWARVGKLKKRSALDFAPRMALNRITRRRRPARTGAVPLGRPFQVIQNEKVTEKVASKHAV